jgi:hypothetical protein
MGYEIKLLVGYVFPHAKGRKSLSEIASIDLCKSVFHHTYIDESDKENPVGIYHGDKVIYKDSYDELLYAIDPQKVLDAMVSANKKQPYRRYKAAIPMLESLIADFATEDIKCVLYGH